MEIILNFIPKMSLPPSQFMCKICNYNYPRKIKPNRTIINIPAHSGQTSPVRTSAPPVAPEMVDCVLDGLQAAVGKTDVVGSSSVAAVSVLGVTELVAAVVVLHCVGKYVASLEHVNISTEDIGHRYHIDKLP